MTDQEPDKKNVELEEETIYIKCRVAESCDGNQATFTVDPDDSHKVHYHCTTCDGHWSLEIGGNFYTGNLNK